MKSIRDWKDYDFLTFIGRIKFYIASIFFWTKLFSLELFFSFFTEFFGFIKFLKKSEIVAKNEKIDKIFAKIFFKIFYSLLGIFFKKFFIKILGKFAKFL